MKKISYFLDKRKSKADGTYPIKLLIKISSSSTRNIENISLTTEKWEKLREEHLKRIKIETEHQRGQQIINDVQKEECFIEENFFKIFDFWKSTKECISNKKKRKILQFIYIN